MSDADPKEVHAIVGKLLELIGEHLSCSDDILIAALKITATIVDETRMAQFGAEIRAGMLKKR